MPALNFPSVFYPHTSYFESRRIWANGLVVGELCDSPSHWNNRKSLDAWLAEQGVPGIQGVDTRRLTKVIRSKVIK